MEKFLVLAICYFMSVASQAHPEDLDRNLLSFQGKPKLGHIEAIKDNYVKQLFSQLLGRKLSAPLRKGRTLHVEHLKRHVSLSRLEDPSHSKAAPAPPMHEALFLHRELQNRLGWGSDDNGSKGNKNQYGPPQSFSQSNQQYGPPPPPNQQYGPPPAPNQQQYGPPPQSNQQYGPPPQLSQQYGPPPPPNQQYGPPPQSNKQHGPPPPPNQQYGPPPPPNQQYGPPPPPNQQYGPPPPPNQQYGPPPPPNQEYGPPPSPNQQYGPPPAPNQQYGPPPSPNQQYGPPPASNQQYGPPSQSNQQYGPPPPPNQQYGAPQEPNQQYGAPQEPNQQYGAPQEPNQNQQYGPPAAGNQEYGPPQPLNNVKHSGKGNIRVNQGTFGGHIENFKLSEAVTKNNDNAYSPPPQQQYGPPSFNDISSFNDEKDHRGNSKIYKHVYIHTPPAEPQVREKARVIRPNKKQDTHYQIIFVKAPTPPQQPPTEIELPSPPERKTLVYVLVKKPEKPAEIKFRTAPPTQPSKPEVYFIRYKGNQKNNGNNGGQEQYGVPENQSFNDIDVDTPISPNDGYSNSYESQPQIISSVRKEAPIAGIANNLIRDSVGYPNTEYRATPNMLSPNQEPMSIAVYDRVRNGVMPSNSAGNGGSLVSASSNVISRTVRIPQGSHYTAPGSKPFKRASGKMVDGQYIGMTTTNVQNRQSYSENRRSFLQ